ncbi:MAG: RNA-binding cell elongation regulator Jag/EloR [Thermodesulfobacteriota bacterium]|nr:RNA-binding cell elongation regulator Jag/EloR [Thermodesulfobacteriota bacterium]
MASEYEFEAKTKEEAVATACEELGLSEDQLEIDVISYGSTGIFGLVGVKKARIKVTVPESQEAKIEPPAPAPAHAREEAAEGDVAEMAREALEKIISSIVEDTTVTAEARSDSLRLKVEGGNSALLIGKHGRTLDALQYIVQRIVHKQKKTRLRISIDVEGYRDRRKASLTQLALRLGDKVKRSGKPATINPMNAYDRRIIHIALKDNAAVKTQSMGNGTFRKLVIYPLKKRRRPAKAQKAG